MRDKVSKEMLQTLEDNLVMAVKNAGAWPEISKPTIHYRNGEEPRKIVYTVVVVLS